MAHNITHRLRHISRTLSTPNKAAVALHGLSLLPPPPPPPHARFPPPLPPHIIQPWVRLLDTVVRDGTHEQTLQAWRVCSQKRAATYILLSPPSSLLPSSRPLPSTRPSRPPPRPASQVCSSTHQRYPPPIPIDRAFLERLFTRLLRTPLDSVPAPATSPSIDHLIRRVILRPATLPATGPEEQRRYDEAHGLAYCVIVKTLISRDQHHLAHSLLSHICTLHPTFSIPSTIHQTLSMHAPKSHLLLPPPPTPASRSDEDVRATLRLAVKSKSPSILQGVEGDSSASLSIEVAWIEGLARLGMTQKAHVRYLRWERRVYSIRHVRWVQQERDRLLSELILSHGPDLSGAISLYGEWFTADRWKEWPLSRMALIISLLRVLSFTPSSPIDSDLFSLLLPRSLCPPHPLEPSPKCLEALWVIGSEIRDRSVRARYLRGIVTWGGVRASQWAWARFGPHWLREHRTLPQRRWWWRRSLQSALSLRDEGMWLAVAREVRRDVPAEEAEGLFIDAMVHVRLDAIEARHPTLPSAGSVDEESAAKGWRETLTGVNMSLRMVRTAQAKRHAHIPPETLARIARAVSRRFARHQRIVLSILRQLVRLMHHQPPSASLQPSGEDHLLLHAPLLPIPPTETLPSLHLPLASELARLHGAIGDVAGASDLLLHHREADSISRGILLLAHARAGDVSWVSHERHSMAPDDPWAWAALLIAYRENPRPGLVAEWTEMLKALGEDGLRSRPHLVRLAILACHHSERARLLRDVYAHSLNEDPMVQNLIRHTHPHPHPHPLTHPHPRPHP